MSSLFRHARCFGARPVVSIVVVLTLMSAACPPLVAAQDDGSGIVGVVAEGEWEGPQFGTSIAWTETWTPEPEFTFSNTETEIEQVSLKGDQGIYVGTTLLIRDETPESHRDFLQRTRAEFNEALDYTLIESSENDLCAWFAYSTIENGTEFVVAIEVFYISDELLGMSEVIAPAPKLPQAFADIQNEITFNGETPFGYYYTADTIPTAAVGITDANAYQSPQFGAEVTWNTSWEPKLASTWSDADAESDTLTIGSGLSDLSVTFANLPGETLEDVVGQGAAGYASDEYFADAVVASMGSDDDGAWLVLTAEQDGSTVVVLLEATWYDEDASTVQLLELVVWLEDVEIELDLARSTVSIDGLAPFGSLPADPLDAPAG
jgi:hypothetical protein